MISWGIFAEQVIFRLISLRIWSAGCQHVVFVRFLNVSVTAVYSALLYSIPLYSTLLGWAAKRYKTKNSERCESKTTYICTVFSLSEKQISTNVLPANVSEASTQKRGWETSQLRLLTLTPKRYKTKHVFIISPKKAYICNASELLWNYKLTKRVAR